MMSHPDFSGSWRFRASESALEITLPDVVLLTIYHKAPLFHLERTLTFGERTDTFAIDLHIDADPVPFVRGDATLHCCLRRDGSQLVFRTRIVRPEEEALNEVRYHLTNDGTVLVAEEHFEGATQHYHNRWVFAKDDDGVRPAGA